MIRAPVSRVRLMCLALALVLFAPASIGVSQDYQGSPPLAKRPPDIGIDLIAHWYNDFGLESTRRGKGQYGWEGWYDWRWNIRNGEAIDPRREPLQGWFHGDDPRILDWQCYWLMQAGIRAVTLVPAKGIALDKWRDPGNPTHWIYQYLNHAPNCKNLPYILFAMSEFGMSASEHVKAWNDTLDVMRRYPSFYAVYEGKRSYPCVYLWEGEALRGAFDQFNGAQHTMAFLIGIADRMKKEGYGGICLLVRHASGAAGMSRDVLKKAGVLYIPADYSTVSGERSGAHTMDDLTRMLSAPTDGGVVSVVTARQSLAHPSNFKLGGDTPRAFERLLSKAVKIVRRNPDLPQMVTIYSVWEWAEGGANLSPSRGDGFAYLDAVRNVVKQQENAAPH